MFLILGRNVTLSAEIARRLVTNALKVSSKRSPGVAMQEHVALSGTTALQHYPAANGRQPRLFGPEASRTEVKTRMRAPSAVIRKQLDRVVEPAHRIFADTFEIEIAFDEAGKRTGQQHRVS